MKYLKDQISQLPEYSRLNIMILVYGHKYQKLSDIEKQINLSFKDDIDCERILNLQIIPLCFHVPIKRRKISSLNQPQALKQLLLAYILDDLEQALLQTKILSTEELELEPHSLRSAIDGALVDLSPIIHESDPSVVKC